MPSVGDGCNRSDMSNAWAKQRHALQKKIESAEENKDVDKAKQYAFHLRNFGKRKRID